MYTQFLFNEGNPYITTTNKELFRMVCKYYIEQFDNNSFVCTGLIEWNGNRKSYEGKKEVLRNFAINWQNFDDNYSYGELSNWQDFFREYGKKYGLLNEFTNNGIC